MCSLLSVLLFASFRAQGLPNPQANAEHLQEQLLKAKYGGLLPKKKLVPRDHK